MSNRTLLKIAGVLFALALILVGLYYIGFGAGFLR